MPKHRAQPVTPASLAEMALVSDLVQAADAMATGSPERASALIQVAGRKLDAIPLERWERVFELALQIVARRTEDDREQHLRALADVVGRVGVLAGAAQLNEGTNP